MRLYDQSIELPSDKYEHTIEELEEMNAELEKQIGEWQKIMDEEISKGITQGRADMCYKLIQKGRMTVEEAAEEIGMTVEKIKKEYEKYSRV